MKAPDGSPGWGAENIEPWKGGTRYAFEYIHRPSTAPTIKSHAVPPALHITFPFTPDFRPGLSYSVAP